MKISIATFLKGLGSLGTGILLAGIFAPAAGTSTLGVFVIAIGYAMLVLAGIGNVMDIRMRYPESSHTVGVLKAICALLGHLGAACFVTALGQLIEAMSVSVTVLALVNIASLLLMSLIMAILSLVAYIAYRLYRDQ